MASNAYNLERFIEILESWGLTDVMLPFLLIFTIVFAVLQKTNILGTGRKNYNMVVSLVLALLVVIPHVLGVIPENQDPVNIINQSILSIAVILVAVVMLLLIIGIFGGESKWTGALTGWVTIAALVIVVIIFGAAAGWWTGWSWFTDFFSEDAVAIIVILLVFGIIIAFITSGGEAERKASIIDRVGNLFGEFMGKGK